MDQTAPPPYSETDVFSNTNTTIPTPTTTEADDASRVNGRGRSDSSSTENSLIYTPPYSPTEPDDQHSESNPKHLSPHDYFESRPLPPQFSAPRTTQHEICVTRRSTSDDVPIPSSAPDYGITQQDWSTFVNYLLPNHTLNVNHDVADRKLKAELIDERMHRLTLNENDYSRLDMNEVQAQLHPLRHPVTASNTDWIGHVDEVIQIWNSGFFLPRGLEILRIDVEQPELFRDRDNNMPGSWIPGEEEESRIPERNRGRRGFLSRYSMSGQGARGVRLGSMVADDEGLRIGRNGIVANSSGLRIGNMFVADDKGLRVGGSRGIVADEDGVSIGGCRFGGRGRGGMHTPEINRGQEQEPEEWHGRNGWGRGGIHSREASWRWAEPPEGWYERRGRGRGGLHTQDHHRGGRHESEGYHRGHSQFHHDLHERKRRDYSSSSSPSSSSSSSSSSSISLASLPSPEHLPDHQLPAAKESLLAWLHHPEYPTTQQTIQRLRQDIQSAKKNKNKNNNKNKKNPNSNIGNSSSTEDLATLRKEVADLLRKFNDDQKSQKTIRKILRKEQRGLKKAHRKERKSTRKSERKGAKKEKKDKKKEKKCNKRDISRGIPSTPIPTYPDIPEIPSARFPPLPNLPVPSFHTPFFGAQNPSMATMYGRTWPFLSSPLPHPQPHIPPQIPRSSYAQNSSQIHAQASSLLASATAKEVEARTLEVVLESAYLNGRERDGDVLEREKKKQEVERLLEESGELRREGERLMAEATQMDGEFAREIQKREREGEGEGQAWAGWLGINGGQSSGVFGRGI